MEKVKMFFKEIKWQEYLFIAVCLATYISLGIVFNSTIMVILNAIFGFSAKFFVSKANVVGQILGLMQLPFYAYVCYQNSYFGELIVCALICLPMYVLSIISWFRNLHSSGGSVKINSKISLKEWIIVLSIGVLMSVGIYFLLDHFNTSELVLSTISVVTSAIAFYIVMRRNSYGFIFFIINNLTCLTMWVLVVVNYNDFSQIVTFFNYIFYLVINVGGLFNFAKLKKEQDDDSFDKILKIVKEK